MLTLDQAKQCLTYRYASSFTRMAALIELYGPMVRPDWLKLLGESWTSCDDLFRYTDTLRGFLGDAGPIPELMSSEEYSRWEKLPDVLTVYRGGGRRNRRGASWSLDPDVAERFPFLNRYGVDDPTLYTARVRKKWVLAVKLDRDEEEIITFKAQVRGARSLSIRNHEPGTMPQ